MRKVIAFVLGIALCVTSLSVSVYGEDNIDINGKENYQKYVENESTFEALFCNNETVGYLSMVEHMESNPVISSAIDMSSQLIGESLEKQDYAEILANLISMQEGDFAEQVEQQAQYDDLKNTGEYAEDITSIALGAFGNSSVMDEISPIIDAATGGKDVIVENLEQAKYYQTSMQSFIQTDFFLEAIKQYAEIDELKDAADSLLRANETLLEKRVEYIADSTETIGEYEAGFFIDNLSISLLKSSDIYKTDDTVKWFVDCGESLLDTVLSTFQLGELAFHTTMLAGDIGFGTSNMFNRYQEMKVVADVANALIRAIQEEKKSTQDAEDITYIQQMCKYYRALLVTHARGEYLVYQLLMNDAGLLSEFRKFEESFLDPEDTTESWYNSQIGILGEYSDIINQILFEGDSASEEIGLEEGTYVYEDGEYLSHLVIDKSSGNPQFTLSFWYNYGASASVEDFIGIPIIEGQTQYQLQGNRSRQQHEITFTPQSDGTIWVKVENLESSNTWYGNALWVDAAYVKSE